VGAFAGVGVFVMVVSTLLASAICVVYSYMVYRQLEAR
jgi:hypothetical protein